LTALAARSLASRLRRFGRRMAAAAAGGAILAASAGTGALAQRTDNMMRHVVRPGETLSELSQRFLRRPSDWPRIAELNRVADPRRLPVGETLLIPIEMLRQAPRPATGRVAGFQGQVTVTEAGRSAPVRMDQTLGEGAIIETGANAHLRLVLSDGSAVAVPSNTRLRIDRLRADGDSGALDREFTLLQGRLESRVTTVGRGGGYSVRTPVSVSAVRGTDFRSTYDETEGRALTEVLEGGVAVDAGGAADLVAPGYGAVATAAGVTLHALPAAPYLASGGAALTTDEATFDITPVPGAAAYRLKLATDTALSGVLMEVDGAPGQTRLSLGDLPDGFHVVAISAVSAEGLEGPRSVYDVLRARNDIHGLSAAPEAGERSAWLFQWASDGPATPRYRFVLSRRGDDRPVIDQAGLTEARTRATDLRPGAYEWRVRSSRTVQGQLVDVWSPPQTLVVR
jgi:hypothetical protein